jgi:hypothetical protein
LRWQEVASTVLVLEQNPTFMSNQVRFDENAACERCGQYGVYLFDGEKLCAACYEKRGSCCPEFGCDDLWTNEDGTPRQESERQSAENTTNVRRGERAG